MSWFILTLPLAVCGHLMLCVLIWNYSESTSIPLWIRGWVSRLAVLASFVCPPLAALALVVLPTDTVARSLLLGYGTICLMILGTVGPHACRLRMRRSAARCQDADESDYEDVPVEGLAQSTTGLSAALLHIPGNQIFQLETNEKELVLPRMEADLDGLTIAHLSDLHFTGQVPRHFFDRAVELVNEMDADIVAITGDIVDNPRCMSWISSTLGLMRARHGVYAILGNHDCKVNQPTLRKTLARAGVEVLSGRLARLDIRDRAVFLAANELPWIMPTTDMNECPDREQLAQLRILLSHSPDQADWARQHDFDLMLAGHTHGGQFCLPWFGAVVCPSARPLALASGTYYEPPTMLHISRGLSAQIPLRLNARPELTRLVLRSPHTPLPKNKVQTNRAEPLERDQPQPAEMTSV